MDLYMHVRKTCFLSSRQYARAQDGKKDWHHAIPNVKWLDLQKSNIITHFQILFTIWIPKCTPQQSFSFICQIVLGVTVLQSNNTREIDLYSKHLENQLQTLTNTVVTFECNAVKTLTLHHHVCHELGNELLGKLFLLTPFFVTNKDEIYEKNYRTWSIWFDMN